MKLNTVLRYFLFWGFASYLDLSIAQDLSLLNYQGLDRNQKIVAAAQKEQVVTIYSALRPSLLRIIIDPFEKKYNINNSKNSREN